MCGIVGVINGEARSSYSRDLNLFMQTGCLWGMVRGADSTGLLQVDKKGNAKIIKSIVDGYNFLQRKNVITALNAVDDSPLTLMHHRAATHGTVSYDNCHPFEHALNKKWVCGVHNGTIGGFSRKEDGKEFDVDSDWLYYRIARDGAAKALGDLTHGAYALVWMEKPENKVFIAANKDRPIHFAFIEKRNIALVASEAEMLYAMAKRHNLNIERPKWPDPEGFYEFDIFGDLRSYKKFPLEKKKYVPHTPVSYHGTGARQSFDLRPGPNGHRAINDSYQPDALKAIGLSSGEDVEFIAVTTDMCPSPNLLTVKGELLTDKAEIMPAIINSCSRIAYDNMQGAKEVRCKVIGSRVVKEGGKDVTYAILSAPHTIVTVDEEDLKASIPDVKGPGNRQIPVPRFLELTKHGCSNCQANITVAMADELAWVSGNPVCNDCAVEMAYGDYYSKHGHGLD